MRLLMSDKGLSDSENPLPMTSGEQMVASSVSTEVDISSSQLEGNLRSVATQTTDTPSGFLRITKTKSSDGIFVERRAWVNLNGSVEEARFMVQTLKNATMNRQVVSAAAGPFAKVLPCEVELPPIKVAVSSEPIVSTSKSAPLGKNTPVFPPFKTIYAGITPGFPFVSGKSEDSATESEEVDSDSDWVTVCEEEIEAERETESDQESEVVNNSGAQVRVKTEPEGSGKPESFEELVERARKYVRPQGCFNCKSTKHKYNRCTVKLGLLCRVCGLSGVKFPDCPICQKMI